MTERARRARGWSSMALVRPGLVTCLFVSAACGRSGLSAGDFDPGEPDPVGGSSGTHAGAGLSGTGFSGTAGAPSGGVSTGGAAGNAGFAGTQPVGGAGQGGSGGRSGSAGMAGSAEVVDRGVVVAWANDRWVVVTPTHDSRALATYEVSELGALLAGPHEVAVEQESDLPITLFDAAREPSTGNLGIIGDSAFITVSERLDHALVSASLGPSDCFLRRIECLLDLFVFVSVRRTFEGTTTVLETPGVIDGDPGFYQEDVSWIGATDCRSVAFAPFANRDGGLGVDFAYPLRTLETAPLVGGRLYDRSGSSGSGYSRYLGQYAPLAPDFDGPMRLDLVRIGARGVVSFRDSLQNGTRYLLVDEYAFTVTDDIVQHAPLRLAAPMKGDDEGFVQVVVVDGSPPRLELRELWTGDVPYRSLPLAGGEIVAAHLARGPEGVFAIALRVARPSGAAGTGMLSPGLYLLATRRHELVFRTLLPEP